MLRTAMIVGHCLGSTHTAVNPKRTSAAPLPSLLGDFHEALSVLALRVPQP